MSTIFALSAGFAQDSVLRDLDQERVILTPHNVAACEASCMGKQRLAMGNTITVLGGNRPRQYIRTQKSYPPGVEPGATNRRGRVVRTYWPCSCSAR
jgi:hypothetical protein